MRAPVPNGEPGNSGDFVQSRASEWNMQLKSRAALTFNESNCAAMSLEH
jgi:hypothetical protein